MFPVVSYILLVYYQCLQFFAGFAQDEPWRDERLLAHRLFLYHGVRDIHDDCAVYSVVVADGGEPGIHHVRDAGVVKADDA